MSGNPQQQKMLSNVYLFTRFDIFELTVTPCFSLVLSHFLHLPRQCQHSKHYPPHQSHHRNECWNVENLGMLGLWRPAGSFALITTHLQHENQL